MPVPPPFWRLVPRDSDAMYPAFAQASKSPECTARMIKLVRANAMVKVIVPLLIVGVTILGSIAIWGALR
jgi:ABC-type Fe3+ transport system permease subunit